jgi:hypothetical protein
LGTGGGVGAGDSGAGEEGSAITIAQNTTPTLKCSRNFCVSWP